MAKTSPPNAGNKRLILGQGSKIPHATRCNQKLKNTGIERQNEKCVSQFCVIERVSLHRHPTVFIHPFCPMERVEVLDLLALCVASVLISPASLPPFGNSACLLFQGLHFGNSTLSLGSCESWHPSLP